MNKIPNEPELVKKALQVGAVYAFKRAYGKIEAHDSVKLKVEFIYKVLVEDKLIQPLAKDQISDPNMRHKLALWISRQLPADHPLCAGQKIEVIANAVKQSPKSRDALKRLRGSTSQGGYFLAS